MKKLLNTSKLSKSIIMDKLILAGSGYLGGYIIDLILQNQHNFSVKEVCRTKKNRSANVENIIRDFDQEKIDLQFTENSTVIYMAPPSTSSNKDTRIGNFIKNISNLKIKKIIYMSTSGVYGDCGGKTVDENTKVSPITERATRRVDAENQLITFSKKNNVKLIILRVPGIYGKGRLPVDRVKLREPLVNLNESRITNIIHVEDLARICIASIALENQIEIINVSDGSPIKTTAYYEYVYAAINVELPKYITFNQALKTYSEKRLSFLKESRVLNVEKMKKIFDGCIVYKDASTGIKKSLGV
ncbi:NAD-dependent epimerase/dehydratase family protein [Gammaproteobacteria bacterium]|nr:NAD-dependent epimerase/dehydratase family protein [Gammaproteobacteria bacterium]